MAMYPFSSSLKQTLAQSTEGTDYARWQRPGFDIATTVHVLTKPIIEIAGPSDNGFYFLDGIDLPSKPIITNISRQPMHAHPEAAALAAMVEQIVDGRHLPYDDGSIGIILVSYLSLADDHMNDRGEPQAAGDDYVRAQLETDDVALGIIAPDQARTALRLQVAGEAYRALAPGGLLFTDTTLAQLVATQRLGFQLAAFVRVLNRSDDTISYEAILQKPGTQPAQQLL